MGRVRHLVVHRGAVARRCRYFQDPPKWNEALNRLERRFGRTRLRSYPPVVGFALSNYCNQRCRFCSSGLEERPTAGPLAGGVLRADEVAPVRPRDLAQRGGGRFARPPGVRPDRRRRPQGRPQVAAHALDERAGLKGANLEATDDLDYINVSANAATEATYAALIKGGASAS